MLELRAQRAAAATALASVDRRLAGLVAELGALAGKVAVLEAGDGASAQVPSLALVFCAACRMRRNWVNHTQSYVTLGSTMMRYTCNREGRHAGAGRRPGACSDTSLTCSACQHAVPKNKRKCLIHQHVHTF